MNDCKQNNDNSNNNNNNNSKNKNSKPKSYICNAYRCLNRELVPVVCDKCKQNHCLKHRFPSDHACGQPKKQEPKPAAKTRDEMTNRDYMVARKGQQDELKTLREQQRNNYIATQQSTLRTGQFAYDDRLREVIYYINGKRNDGATPYILVTDNNDTPFSLQDLELTFKDLNLIPNSTLLLRPANERTRPEHMISRPKQAWSVFNPSTWFS
ncbi:hypothetical protein SAMD00019534_051240 [Acytostelium subglobosum LB1]|uniref:hypothetical protein n=1 Tax=Acytostelium subglobosum LB1 TaxID=1410327 RepID=UPI0006449DF8|nr:hypothetical protein SAMD00019534_051240 [Acytostelium subglobosum LB1]GAM21949.1 hypothetical protein SAMD00019534_051240 [Acytostelium subglobosum LB1]|eukprot:XP_012755049.1 hypothetical protein SAMD00019534_051240 [Acytostelium subglobosum LB1]